MNVKVKTFVLLPLIAFMAIAQQPNSGYADMTINGAVGPPFPILTNVRTSLPCSFNFTGATNQPYAVFQGAALQPGAAYIPASNSLNSVDLALSPFPVLVIDGFQYPQYFSTDFTGQAAFAINVPPAGNPPNGVPLGLQLSFQAVMGDPFSSIGVTLTAATRITVTQGPVITYYSLGDESSVAITNANMPLPFYGSNYTTLHVNSDGYICFGTSTQDFTPSDVEFVSGPPRAAPFWCDLDCPANSVKVTVDTPQNGGTIPGFVRVDWITVNDYTLPVQHTFSTLIKTDGNLELIFSPLNNASQYDQLTGIIPGNNVGAPQPQKNFVGPQPSGSSVGPGILTTPPFTVLGNVNEGFFEWFGIVTVHQYYSNPYDNPHDLFGITIHAQPAGSGTLPGSTNRYSIY
jgi:hypothetical protein